jgi:carotenoid 1,2-hydratase
VRRAPSTLAIGPSSLEWDGTALTIRIDEITVPIPSRIRGTVRVYPVAVFDHVVALDHAGCHRWSPIAPRARVEVELTHPALRWNGTGYLDSNAGDAPLESAFVRWHWSRACVRNGTAVLYDITRRNGDCLSLAMRFGTAGEIENFAAPPAMRLPHTRWRVGRSTRTDNGDSATVLRTLEDTPFYARSILSARVLGTPVTALHESLSLERFDTKWVQVLLPFRMPRRRG